MGQVSKLCLESGDSLLKFFDLIQALVDVGVQFLVLFVEVVYFCAFLAGFLELLLEVLELKGELGVL